MVIINNQGRPTCAKCRERSALTLMDSLWVCGECLHEYIQKQEKLNQKAFLEC